MNKYEVTAYLEDHLPAIKADIKLMSPQLNIFKSIGLLADYTRKKVTQHDLPVVKKCFAIAENIYFRGNGLVRDAIENVFIYSFSTLLNLGSKKDNQELQSIMPLSLYHVYVHQVFKSGI